MLVMTGYIRPYGRKIEKALTLKENKKSNIKIISEKHWLEQTRTN